MTVDVEAVVAGTVPMPRAYAIRPPGPRLKHLPSVLRPGSDVIEAPFLWYLVRHPEQGVVLIDTGVPRDVSYPGFLGLLFGKLRPADQPFDEQLRSRDVDPADVRLVLMTHLHADHTAGMPMLPNAEFVIGRREWAAVTESKPMRNGSVGDHLPPADRVRPLDVATDGEPHGPFARTHDLFGDGSVRLVATPGHSPGHLSVLLDRGEGGKVLVVGDAAYTLESIRTQTLPLFTADEKRYRESLAQIAAYATTEPDATIVPTHDPDAWRALAHPDR